MDLGWLLKFWFGNVQRRWRWFDSLSLFPGCCFFFIFLSFPFLSPPQSGAERVIICPALLSVKSSARPGGKSSGPGIAPVFMGHGWTGSAFVCMNIYLALNSVLGEAKTSWRRAQSSFLPISETPKLVEQSQSITFVFFQTLWTLHMERNSKIFRLKLKMQHGRAAIPQRLSLDQTDPNTVQVPVSSLVESLFTSPKCLAYKNTKILALMKFQK